MTIIEQKRMDRCQDCICLVKMTSIDGGGWYSNNSFCDEYKMKCIDVVKCGEWEYDTSLYTKEEIKKIQDRVLRKGESNG